MVRLGTWTTIGCPVDKLNGDDGIINIRYIYTAHEWLKERFGKIGGKVRLVYNDHDFGMYPSFEVDMPDELVGLDISELDDERDEYDLFVKVANDIESEYSSRFADNL